jgi:hypothetical protein
MGLVLAGDQLDRKDVALPEIGTVSGNRIDLVRRYVERTYPWGLR